MRLFVAVWPPDEVLDVVSSIPRPDIAVLRWTTRDQWHVTLRFLGETPDADPVEAALGTLAGSGTARALMGPATSWFPGNRLLQVPVAGLESLESEVTRVLTGVAPCSAKDHPYRGHLTLARARGRSRVPAHQARALGGFSLEAAWSVDSLSLVSSLPTARGSQYSDLLTVPLDG